MKSISLIREIGVTGDLDYSSNPPFTPQPPKAVTHFTPYLLIQCWQTDTQCPPSRLNLLLNLHQITAKAFP